MKHSAILEMESICTERLLFSEQNQLAQLSVVYSIDFPLFILFLGEILFLFSSHQRIFI